MQNKPDTISAANKPAKKKRRGPKKPKKITAGYLRNSGLYYLQRFTASSGHFRSVMTQKIRKSCAHHTDQDPQICADMLEEIIDNFIRDGLLDDENYTRGMVTSLRRSGKSRKAILTKLQHKRIPQDMIHEALSAHDDQTSDDPQDAEFIAALKLTKKKRLGRFDLNQKYEHDKALAVMARNGFSYDTAKKSLEIDEDDLERFIHLL
ncbi:MAG: regulatory protein RecX [Bdellovibrionales bacterium]